ncbi:MAG: 30S ribosomal protein S20 [Nitrospiraceae bacterium]|nr:MAG: 30S ribosomal protein S20 [Nitrospiraceae bacterium]
MPAKAAPKRSKSVLKRARQSKVKTLVNKSEKSMLKTLSKNVEQDVANKNAGAAQTALKKAVSAIDKAAKKGIIHRNTASRKISRLTKLVNSMTSSEAA